MGRSCMLFCWSSVMIPLSTYMHSNMISFVSIPPILHKRRPNWSVFGRCPNSSRLCRQVLSICRSSDVHWS
ncbi:hypothetical protein BDV18DRAFT_48341 [Aspergillus unguis]